MLPVASVNAAVAKPGAPVISSIASVSKGSYVNVKVVFALAASNGGSRVTSSTAYAGGKSCTAKGTAKSCTILKLKKATKVSVYVKSKNAKGSSRASAAIRYKTGAPTWKRTVAATPVVTPVVTTPVAAKPVTGSSVGCTILGTSGNDTLIGTSGNDVICGAGGKDVIQGGAGNDTIYSGLIGGVAAASVRVWGVQASGLRASGLRASAGDTAGDVIDGGEGDDTFYGDDGDDVISGGTGDDTITGGAGTDTQNGDAGADTLNGGIGDDTLNGGADNDTLAGDAGADRINGDAGLNLCIVDSSDIFDRDPTTRTCDTEAPKIASVTFDRVSIDTSTSTQTVAMTVEATDDLAGIGTAGCWAAAMKDGSFLSQIPAVVASKTVLTTNQFGDTRVRYAMNIRFPKFAQQGTWVAGYFYCRDNVNNASNYDYQDTGVWSYRQNDRVVELTGSDILPISTIAQTGLGDEELPELVSLTSSASSIDTSAGPVTVTYTARITDDMGLKEENGVSFQFRAGQSQKSAWFTKVSGTYTDGSWSASVVYPKYWPTGSITVNGGGLNDVSGRENRFGFGYTAFPTGVVANSTVSQTGTGDSIAPTVTARMISTSVNTRAASAVVEVEFIVTDNLSGVLWTEDNAQFRFQSDTAGTSADGCLDLWNCPTGGTSTRTYRVVSGNAGHTEMVVRATFVLPQLSPLGQWSLSMLVIPDAVGNEAAKPTLTFVNG